MVREKLVTDGNRAQFIVEVRLSQATAAPLSWRKIAEALFEKGQGLETCNGLLATIDSSDCGRSLVLPRPQPLPGNQHSAVVGSMTKATSAIRLAGKPPCFARSRMVCSSGAI